MDHRPGRGQPSGPVPGHRRRGGLLQRFVGEQPVRHLAQLLDSTPAQQRRLHQHRRPGAESSPRRGDIGNAGGVGQLEFGDRRKRRATGFRPQITDVVSGEAQTAAQEGLTPVTITL